MHRKICVSNGIYFQTITLGNFTKEIKLQCKGCVLNITHKVHKKEAMLRMYTKCPMEVLHVSQMVFATVSRVPFACAYLDSRNFVVTCVISLRACDGGVQRQLCIVSENEWMCGEGPVAESGT